MEYKFRVDSIVRGHADCNEGKFRLIMHLTLLQKTYDKYLQCQQQISIDVTDWGTASIMKSLHEGFIIMMPTNDAGK